MQSIGLPLYSLRLGTRMVYKGQGL